MRTYDNDKLKALLVFLIVGFVGIVFMVMQCQQESKSYNRLTGAHTTAWDAFWLELRVQDSPKEENDGH